MEENKKDLELKREKIKLAIFLLLGITAGVGGVSLAVYKSAENAVLREENTRLRTDIKKTNYYLGRLMTKKIYRK